MKTKETSTIWWQTLTDNQQNQLIVKYKIMRGNGYCDYEDVEEDEVEEIWRKEVGYIPKSNQKQFKEGDTIIRVDPNGKTVGGSFIATNVEAQFQDGRYKKLNQKQFKEFNPELFKAYIDKFSDEDKIEALFILLNELPQNIGERMTVKLFTSKEERDKES